MGKSKQSKPKRRRMNEDNVEQHDTQIKAIETLKNLPPVEVEMAAEQVFSEVVDKYPKLFCQSQEEEIDDNVPKCFEGLAKCSLSEASFATMKNLHKSIKEEVSQNASSWSGEPTDPRRRAFGFVNGSFRDMVDLSLPGTTLVSEQRKKNYRASMLFKSNDPLLIATKKLFEELQTKFGNKIQPSHHEKYLSFEEWIAAQPNMHGERLLLPAHWDHPSKDGFGIIIVTVAVKGNATIFFASHDENHFGKIEIKEGEAYMLSGPVRAACTHGVLATSPGRESLNLRFGLHDRVPNVDPKSEEVTSFWENRTNDSS